MTVRIINADVMDGLSQLADESVHCAIVKKLSDVQIAYIAGLIDGEGSLECQKEIQKKGATPRYTIRLSFCFATKEPLWTVGGWLGIVPKRYESKCPKRSAFWRAHIYKHTSIPLLVRSQEHLILKRDQAKIILAIEAVRLANSPSRKHFGKSRFQRMPDGAVSQMDNLWMRLRALKSNKRPIDKRVTAP